MSFANGPARLCSQCGAGLSLSIDPQDNRERRSCEHCGFVAYENPKVLVACLATWQDKLLIMHQC